MNSPSIAPLRSARLLSLALATALALGGCAVSHHETTPASLGQTATSDALLAVIREPGPTAFEKIVAADWSVTREGLINLDHAKAREAGLESGDEAIQIYLYVLRHPRFGTYLVDSGLEFNEINHAHLDNLKDVLQSEQFGP